MLKTVAQTVPAVVLICLFWLGLTESFSIGEMAFGMTVAVISLLFTNMVILDGKNYASQFSLRVTTVLLYAGYLLYQIYSAGFSAMKRVLTGHTRVRIVDIDTALEDDFTIALLANSITLTPGTVSLHREGSKLMIIWLSDSEEDLPTRNRLIKHNFERILTEGAGKWILWPQ